MTIGEFVMQQPAMGINGWIRAIEEAGLSEQQHMIIECAIQYDRITVNHSASFDNPSFTNTIVNL